MKGGAKGRRIRRDEPFFLASRDYTERSSNMKKTTGMGLLAMASLFLVNSLFAQQISGPRYGGTFVIGVNDEPGGLNPILWVGAEPQLSTAPIFNKLIGLDLKGNPQGDIAQSWEVSQDKTKYTFRLHRNVRWHDGRPFTSADVMWTFMGTRQKYLTHPRYATALDPLVESYEAPDDYTFTLTLKKPFSPFLTLFANDLYGPNILPKHIFDGADVKKNKANWEPIGTGAFKFKGWVKGYHIELVKNENYFKKGKPYLDRLIIRFMPDENARLLALEKGEVDYLYFYVVPYSAVPNLKKNPDIVITDGGARLLGQMQMWIFNLSKPPFNNIKVREAVAYVLDRQRINETAYFGLARPAYSVNGKGIPFWTESGLEKYETGNQTQDLERANKLLDEAGYPRGKDGIRFKTTLLYMSGRAYEGKVGEVAREDLRKVGIELDIQPMDRPTFIEKIFSRWDFDISSQQFSAGPHPFAGIPRYLRWSQHRAGLYPSNAMGYNNPSLEELFDKSVAAKTEAEEAKIWAECQRILSKDLPVLPIVEMPYTGAVRAEWRDVFPGIDAYLRVGETVWWTKGQLPK
jgi:peptide/nickel transport system substrate-binding protein